MEQKENMTLKEQIQWYLDKWDEANPTDKEKLEKVRGLVGRLAIGLKK